VSKDKVVEEEALGNWLSTYLLERWAFYC